MLIIIMVLLGRFVMYMGLYGDLECFDLSYVYYFNKDILLDTSTM
jgi:hypothetical protein